MIDFSEYQAQTVLPEFGNATQARLKRARVLVVGAGGLGCPALLYLASAGVGNITVVDYDTIEASNLHRQTLFGAVDVGKSKADVTASKLKAQYPKLNVEPIQERITSRSIFKHLKDIDVVLDCSDNFMVHYAISDACTEQGIPVIFGAAYQYEGQQANFNLPNSDGTYGPNYRDIWPVPAVNNSCRSSGIMPTLTGLIGCLQANEAIKYLGKIGELNSALTIVDVKTLSFNQVKLSEKSNYTKSTIKTPESINELNVRELESLQAKSNIQHIDVRPTSKFSKQHLSQKAIDFKQVNWPDFRSNSVVFYCDTGNRSALATFYAQERHPDIKFYSLVGGLQAYKTSELKLISVSI